MVTFARPRQFDGADPRSSGIMVSRGVNDGNFLGVQAMQLLEQKAFGLKREPLVVEEVACDQYHIHTFGKRQIDQPPKGQARCVSQLLADRLRPARARRVQMYVGRMNKAHQLPNGRSMDRRSKLVDRLSKLEDPGVRRPGLNGPPGLQRPGLNRPPAWIDQG